jgi:hypothetical protein
MINFSGGDGADVCYPLGGTGARSTVVVPTGSVTVQLTALAARPVFWPYVLAKIMTPSLRKLIDSRTMCWSSIHRLAESPGVPTTVIVPSAHSTVNVSRPFRAGRRRWPATRATLPRRPLTRWHDEAAPQGLNP